MDPSSHYCLSVLVKLCTSILAIPFLEVLLRTLQCDNGTLALVDNVQCWSLQHLPIAIIGVIFVILTIVGSVVLIS